MFKVSVDKAKCRGCETCATNCPNIVFEMIENKSQPAQVDFCEGCETCSTSCPSAAITVSELAAAI